MLPWQLYAPVHSWLGYTAFPIFCYFLQWENCLSLSSSSQNDKFSKFWEFPHFCVKAYSELVNWLISKLHPKTIHRMRFDVHFIETVIQRISCNYTSHKDTLKNYPSLWTKWKICTNQQRMVFTTIKFCLPQKCQLRAHIHTHIRK